MSTNTRIDGSGERQEGPENNNPKRGERLVPAFFQRVKILWQKCRVGRKVIMGVFKVTWIIVKIIEWFDSSEGD